MEKENIIKLTSAVYKVLDFLSESDPIKSKAKEKALFIMESLILICDNGVDNLELKKDVLNDIDIFLSYWKVIKEQRWINVVNFLIVEKEYMQLKKDLGDIVENLGLKETIKESPDVIETKSAIVNNNIKVDFTERQEKVLEVIKNNKKVQVADIIKILPDVTKRTIRRDLNVLLRHGLVVRTGDFNRTFYSVLS